PNLTSRVRDPFPEDGGAGREETRDGGAGREGASETRNWRPRSDDLAARGYGVAVRHIVDGVGGLLPLFVSLRRLLTGVSCDLFKCSSSMTVPNDDQHCSSSRKLAAVHRLQLCHNNLVVSISLVVTVYLSSV
ncbi:unnamed protein product, partial [Urochloa humidicola]